LRQIFDTDKINFKDSFGCLFYFPKSQYSSLQNKIKQKKVIF